MSHEEKDMAIALARCTFLPGSFDKRFAANMAGNAKSPQSKPLTEKQRQCLRSRVIRYRRQIPKAIVGLARQESVL